LLQFSELPGVITGLAFSADRHILAYSADGDLLAFAGRNGASIPEEKTVIQPVELEGVEFQQAGVSTKTIKQGERRFGLRLDATELVPVESKWDSVDFPLNCSRGYPNHWHVAASRIDMEAIVRVDEIYESAVHWYRKAAEAGDLNGGVRLEFLGKWRRRQRAEQIPLRAAFPPGIAVREPFQPLPAGSKTPLIEGSNGAAPASVAAPKSRGSRRFMRAAN